jgi:hypothetical protein
MWPSHWGPLDLQAKVNVWHGLVHGARAQNINLYSRKKKKEKRSSIPAVVTHKGFKSLTSNSALHQITFRNAPARLEQELLSLPGPARAQAACDRSELAALDVVEHDDVGPSRDRLVRLIFVPHFDVQAERKAAHFACARDRRGDGPCAAAAAANMRGKAITSRR